MAPETEAEGTISIALTGARCVPLPGAGVAVTVTVASGDTELDVVALGVAGLLEHAGKVRARGVDRLNRRRRRCRCC